MPELDFIEVLPNTAAGGSLNVTQENFKLTRQNMGRSAHSAAIPTASSAHIPGRRSASAAASPSAAAGAAW